MPPPPASTKNIKETRQGSAESLSSTTSSGSSTTSTSTTTSAASKKGAPKNAQQNKNRQTQAQKQADNVQKLCEELHKMITEFTNSSNDTWDSVNDFLTQAIEEKKEKERFWLIFSEWLQKMEQKTDVSRSVEALVKKMDELIMVSKDLLEFQKGLADEIQQREDDQRKSRSRSRSSRLSIHNRSPIKPPEQCSQKEVESSRKSGTKKRVQSSGKRDSKSASSSSSSRSPSPRTKGRKKPDLRQELNERQKEKSRKKKVRSPSRSTRSRSRSPAARAQHSRQYGKHVHQKEHDRRHRSPSPKRKREYRARSIESVVAPHYPSRRVSPRGGHSSRRHYY
jgi:hypothetical protein